MSGAFARWCMLNGIQQLPASPAVVASFIADCGSLGADRLWTEVVEISREHMANGYADPTVGGPASDAMNAVSKIEPPASWRRTEHQAFHRLPYDLQLYVWRRERERDKAVRQAQNAAAAVRRNDGNQSAA